MEERANGNTDFAGYDVMCKDITQDLINEYYLHLQQAHKSSTVVVNLLVFLRVYRLWKSVIMPYTQSSF